ncbi:MAG TPA: phosphoenolpyruvate--protein phosphotransferase [Vicinamibacterales bacterium]|jgi:phosphotransferase system enzyme I (PtsI)|nr:phosphoenolpyruvate--protein phosphotransferase [Vicinamibacterales bacterium]
MRLNGLGVSPGIGVGKALVLKRGARDVQFRVPASLVTRELDRLDEARARSREQIERIKERIARSIGHEHSYLFDAQLLMLDDAMLVDRARSIISGERLNAASALQRALEQISALFDQAQDRYLRERKGDVADVVGRLCMNLRAAEDPTDLFKDLEGPLVLVADEITPSVIAQLDWQRLAALVSDTGSWTYHTAILARSIRVPAVTGLRNASMLIQPGALVAVDGVAGDVFVDPDGETLTQIRARQQRQQADERALDEFRSLASITEDGVEIRLEANIETPDDAVRATERGAAGIGLFRSEFLLAGAGEAALTEEAQYDAYRRLVESAAPGRVTVRTFDVSETQLSIDHAGFEGARAPLGLRGIRLSLAFDEIFQAQLRALLRAAAHGPLRIMFPFVSGLEDLRTGRAAVERAAETLRTRGEPAPRVPIGVMIEVPSAALTADIIAAEADFFSIGTNDLIQYCLAVDRTDERVSSLYEPLHPAILRTVRLVVRAGRRGRIPVAVCGEMAADPALLTLLVGLGLREFSMAPAALPLAKQVLRSLRAADARRAAGRALKARTAAEVEQTLIELLTPQHKL